MEAGDPDMFDIIHDYIFKQLSVVFQDFLSSSHFCNMLLRLPVSAPREWTSNPYRIWLDSDEAKRYVS